MRDVKFWKKLMEADIGDEVEEIPQESVSKTESDETQIIEELVYPYEMTARMMGQYEDPVFNRRQLADNYLSVLIKLERSIKYWRLTIPKWLISRIQNLI